MFHVAKKFLSNHISFSKKRKRLDAVDKENELLMNIQFGALLECRFRLGQQRLHGGDKYKEILRCCKDLEKDIFQPLGDQYLRRAYRMSRQSFYKLFTILKTELEDEFLPFINNITSNARRKDSKYYINLKIRLSCALQFFAGADPLDLMLTHGISHSSVYRSVWGVVDCINRHDGLNLISLLTINRWKYPKDLKKKVVLHLTV